MAAAEEHRVNFPCAQLQHGEGVVTNLTASAKLSLAAKGGVRLAGSEEKRQGAGPLPLGLTEGERTQAVYSF